MPLIEYRKYCMVCTIGRYERPYDSIFYTEKQKQELEEYENHLRCNWCGNTEHFFEYEYDYQDDNLEKKRLQLEKDLLNNPYYDPEKNKAAQIKDKELSRGIYIPPPPPAPKPKCPTCGSTDVKDISTLDRAVSVGMFGLASGKIGKTKECKNCGYKW